MKRWRKWLVIYGILLISVTTAFLAACTTSHNDNHMTTESMTHSSGGQGMVGHGMGHDMDLGPADNEYDLRFIDGMIIHHEGAVEMAKEAQLKSQRPEILALADAIIAAQAEEIGLMNRWKKEWYPQADSIPVAYDLESEKTVPMSQAQVTAMKMSGDLGAKDAQFDLRFIEAMVPHHQGAVDMALDALAKTQRAEIRNLANEIISAQETEIDLMMSWKNLWYVRQGE